jgi:hypothetical protein
MIASGAQALAAIKTGDLIFGIRDDGRTDLLLVYDANASNFWARNIPNESTYKFGRDGEGRRIEDDRQCTIVSTAALPAEQYQVAIALDRRMGSKPEYPDSRLTKDEMQLILTHARFFEERLLPGTEALVKRGQKLRAVGSMLTLEWDPFNATENPSSVFEYDDHVSDLLALLDTHASKNEVARFLRMIAGLRNRPPHVLERADAAAASLVQLRESWS